MYDCCTLDNEGNLIIFGEHCCLRRARDIIAEDNYDELEDWYKPKKIWLRFCLFHYEGEPHNGYLEMEIEPKSMRGCIVATMLKQRETNAPLKEE